MQFCPFSNSVLSLNTVVIVLSAIVVSKSSSVAVDVQYQVVLNVLMLLNF